MLSWLRLLTVPDGSEKSVVRELDSGIVVDSELLDGSAAGSVDEWSHVRMLGLFVAAQIDLALEGLVAQFTGKRFVASVFSGMRNQVGALAERFAAHLTFVRFFAWKEI